MPCCQSLQFYVWPSQSTPLPPTVRAISIIMAERRAYAAHSTVRALLSTYNGPLYQVRRKSDSKTKDIGVLTPGGYANTAQADSFCSGTNCDLTAIYDQSGKGNDLWYQGSTMVPASSSSSSPSNVTTESLTSAVTRSTRSTSMPGTAIGGTLPRRACHRFTAPEGMYMVTSGTHYNGGCCFDYGNSETDRAPTAPAPWMPSTSARSRPGARGPDPVRG